ncbi:Nn.00g056180.m01.CDS01 [Neocucurbitaria sp. VM-36]
MGLKKTILLASALALSAFSAPLPDCPDSVEEADAVGTTALTAENLIAIEPATASCAGADFPEECADATAAATAINKSFETYGITSTGEQAALVAYMLFESGNFKYSKNHFPGRPGQGTRMMAMPPFVKLYANSAAGSQAVAQAESAGGDAGLNAVLALVNSDDEKSFGSAAWFLTSQCTADVRAGLVAETVDGWHNFLTACVGTTAAAERDVPWVAAKQIMLGN